MQDDPLRPAKALDSFLIRLGRARVLILFAFHAIVFATAYLAAYLTRFEIDVPAEYVPILKSSFAVVVGLQLLVGLAFGFYRGWWRYVGIRDVMRLVAGLTLSLTILVALWYAGPIVGLPARYVHTPRGVLLVDWAFSLLMLFGIRALISLMRAFPERRPGGLRRVVIVGAGDAGETLAREIEHRPHLGMRVVGFVDDQRAKSGSQIRGIPVHVPISKIRTIAASLAADEALIAIPHASGKRIREIIRHLSESGLEYKTIPAIDEIVSGKVVTQLRPVDLEDLLRRGELVGSGHTLLRFLKGTRVMITGAGGTIASELASQVLQFGPESLSLVERSEFALYEVRNRLAREASWALPRISSNLLDICDSSRLEALIARERPEIVLHAAAHKHVPLGEENAVEYLRNNTLATRRLAEICIKHGVRRFVFVSSDKAINPTSVMGATKRAAEILLQDAVAGSKMRLTIVRFGNVIGSSGSVIPLFIEQIAAGGPVTVTHPDATRYFIRRSEAVSLVLQAATLDATGDVLMLDMGEPLRIVDLARDLIRLSQHAENEIPIVFTGLRPGEKIFEETHMKGESIHPTNHPQIVVTEAVQPHPRIVADWLASASAVRGADMAVRWLRDLIPEYVPNGLSAEHEAQAPEPRQRDLAFAFPAVLNPTPPRIVM